MEAGSKLRILCLHGSRQSAAILQKRCKTLIKKCSPVAELAFLDAPHKCQGDDAQDSFCWWLPGLAKGEAHPEWAAQWAASHAILCNVLQEAAAVGRPFDGVLGFSNGAATAAILLTSQPEACQSCQLQFALLAGGYLPNILEGLGFKLEVPSLHMQGAGDALVTPQQHEQLQGLFIQPLVHTHDQGHVIPQRAADTTVIVAFLRDQLANKSRRLRKCCFHLKNP